MLLAAAGGNGVMIWDASGQSLSPLITRLTCCDSWYQYHTTASASSSSSPITPNSKADQNNQATVSSWEEVTSVAWRGSKHPFLVTSTSSQISLWDLRTARNRTHRPCLRYASPFTANTGNHSTAPPSSTSHFVHVACDESSCEIAAMDKSGLVRIYDDRASSSLRGRPVAHFWAHDKGGVGIASLHQSNGAYWVTWGKDSLTFQSDNDCSVCQAKLWRDITQQNDQSDPPETVFDSDKNTVLDMEGTKSYTMLSLLGSQEVYCARVCPGPFSDAIVTVGPSTSKPCRSFESTTPATSTKMHHPDGWQAELWKIHPRHSDHAKRLGMFSAGDSDDGDLTEIFGPNHDLGSLIGAELAVGSSPFSANRSELQLCSLTSNGHLTTFVSISEQLPISSEIVLPCTPAAFLPTLLCIP